MLVEQGLSRQPAGQTHLNGCVECGEEAMLNRLFSNLFALICLPTIHAHG